MQSVGTLGQLRKHALELWESLRIPAGLGESIGGAAKGVRVLMVTTNCLALDIYPVTAPSIGLTRSVMGRQPIFTLQVFLSLQKEQVNEYSKCVSFSFGRGWLLLCLSL